jgi:hypothetical protein
MGKLDDNMQAAQYAVAVVDLELFWGAANKPEETLAQIKRIQQPRGTSPQVVQDVFEMELMQQEGFMGFIRSTFAKKYPQGAEPWTEQKLVDLATIARQVHAGQCTEQAAVAFTYLLRNRSVKPLDFMLQQPRELDHVFFVVGRQRGKVNATEWPIDKSPPWGPDAVVCDPWSPQKDKRAYPASEIPKVMPRPWGVESLLRVE